MPAFRGCISLSLTDTERILFESGNGRFFSNRIRYIFGSETSASAVDTEEIWRRARSAEGGDGLPQGDRAGMRFHRHELQHPPHEPPDGGRLGTETIPADSQTPDGKRNELARGGAHDACRSSRKGPLPHTLRDRMSRDRGFHRTKSYTICAA